MFDTLLPRSVDNTYRRHKIAVWLLGLVVMVTILQGAAAIVSGYSIVRDAD
jgi:hypothetical protein